MAGNMLRASGNFKETTQATPQVLIQINTSDPNTLLKTAKSTPDKVSDININLNPNKKENDDQSIANLSILCGE